MPPQTRYAANGEIQIAYQVVERGSPSVDLVYVPNRLNQIEHLWADPGVTRYLERLASFARLIIYDRRGTGLSDRMVFPPTLEDEMGDILAVMDAAGSERAALIVMTEGGPTAAFFAATYPDRVSALILYAAMVAHTRHEDIDWAWTEEERLAMFRDVTATWGEATRVDEIAPSMAGDPRFRAWYGGFQRLAHGPGDALRMLQHSSRIDVREVLPTIRVPTLVIRRRDEDVIDPRHAHYLAEHIPGAKLVEVPGRDLIPSIGDDGELVDEIEEFLTGARAAHEPDRVLATVLFSDIVDSTRRAAEVGDRRWRETLETLQGVVLNELSRFRGRAIKALGDGFLATFDGPARGIRCAAALRDAAHPLGLEIRSGLHTGEVEVMGDDVGGLAVHICARVCSSAQPGEVLVSGTVRDLVVGSGIEFADRGEHQLKGVPGEWRLFAVAA
jgi:class 3 adenylate cyclase/alpha-beta hydrolase superfamily lysophospholipase